jgi:hypothetical protein
VISIGIKSFHSEFDVIVVCDDGGCWEEALTFISCR